MKIALMNITANLVSLSCVGCAGYLVLKDKDGWGWFLLVALICQGAYRIGNKKDEEG